MSTDPSPFIAICEAGPRDALQNKGLLLSVETRVELIDRLSACELPRIEVVSIVNPGRVPQMTGDEEVLACISTR